MIPWEVEQLNIGWRMNLKTSVFTVPINGRYFFSFNAISNTATNSKSFVRLRVNGVGIQIGFSQAFRISMPLVATLNLKKGDKIDVILGNGALMDNANEHTSFTGMLLEEDLFFSYIGFIYAQVIV